MKLLIKLRRMFQIDTSDVKSFDPGRIHDLLATLRAESAHAVPRAPR